MASKFKLKEPLEAGVRRIVGEQFDRIVEDGSMVRGRETWVHETRKAIKRIRALLRLVRSGIARDDWERENSALRDIARVLSPMRDGDVMGHVTRRLMVGDDDKLVMALVQFEAEGVRRGLKTGLDDAEASKLVGRARDELRSVKKRLTGLDVRGDTAGVARRGLATGFRRGQEALGDVLAESSDERIHDLRKAVQIYWRQCGFLSAAWPDVQAIHVASARALSQMLGEMQDYAVMVAAAQDWQGKTQNRRQSERIIAACRQNQADVVGLALPLARRLFAGEPKSRAAEVAEWWEAAGALAMEASKVPKSKLAKAEALKARAQGRQGRSLRTALSGHSVTGLSRVAPAAKRNRNKS